MDAELHQQRSREMVLWIAHGQPPEEPLERPAPGLSSQVEALFESWAAEDGQDRDGVLRRAMHSQTTAPTTPLAGRVGAPMTPAATGRPAAAFATADPYLGATVDALPVSPTQPHLTARAAARGATMPQPMHLRANFPSIQARETSRWCGPRLKSSAPDEYQGGDQGKGRAGHRTCYPRGEAPGEARDHEECLAVSELSPARSLRGPLRKPRLCMGGKGLRP